MPWHLDLSHSVAYRTDKRREDVHIENLGRCTSAVLNTWFPPTPFAVTLKDNEHEKVRQLFQVQAIGLVDGFAIDGVCSRMRRRRWR